MDVFAFVLAIVALTIVGRIVSKYLGNRGQKTSGEIDKLLGRVDVLTQRVQVLEKIVTDDSHRLKKDIDELEAN
ncbi:MAG: hypothetical protein KUG75_10285 [Pseudomonadales bacterium]|nr:hypothetical protein [Pseudomonadales bacterium]